MNYSLDLKADTAIIQNKGEDEKEPLGYRAASSLMGFHSFDTLITTDTLTLIYIYIYLHRHLIP